jgi:hypothetical protein
LAWDQSGAEQAKTRPTGSGAPNPLFYRSGFAKKRS